MLIKVDSFSGIIPKISPRLLPGQNARIANNADPTSGRLEPIDINDAASEETVNNVDYPDAITAPSTPVVSQPATELFDADSVSCLAWVFKYENGEHKATYSVSSGDFSMSRIQKTFTETGLKLVFRMSASITLVYNHEPDEDPLTVELRGGQYQLDLGALGTIPETAPSASGGAIFGTNEITLTDDGHDYGKFRIISVENGSFVQSTYMKKSSLGNTIRYVITLEQRDVTFNIDLGYDDNLPELVSYIATNVTVAGLEGPPSDPSSMVTREKGKRLNVAVSGSNCNLYRTVAGTNTEDFYLISSEQAGTYVDWGESDEVGEPLAEKWGDRPEGMLSLLRMPGNFVVAYKDSTLYFSEPQKDHVWPEEYQITLNITDRDGAAGSIVGIEVVGDTVVVATDGQPFVVSGYHPEHMTAKKLTTILPCVSAESICRLHDVVYYASDWGLVMQRGYRADVVSYEFFTAEGWGELEPENMTITYAGDKLYVTGIDTDGGDDEPLGITAEGLMFVLKNYIPEILITLNSDDYLTWKSKMFQLGKPVTWSCARVIASDYSNIVLRLFSKDDLDDKFDEEITFTYQVPSDAAFRLPVTLPSKTWGFQVTAENTKIDAVYLSTSMTEIRDAT